MKKYIKKILPKSIKRLLIKILKFFSKKHTTIPAEELKVFELLKDSMHIVFDIGAREDLSFFDIKKDCVYHLFEPNKKFVKFLEKKVLKLKTNNIKVNDFGLSDKDEDNCTYYEDGQSFVKNPFLENIDEGQRYSLKKLDNYVSENKIPYINFLKIDAEGMDYKIIMGGINVVRGKTDYIQFEYWDGVKKFVDILDDTFDLYLMIEPQLRSAILTKAFEVMTENEKNKKYDKSLILLDQEVVNLIDNILIPRGFGGNIFGVKKTINNKIIENLAK